MRFWSIWYLKGTLVAKQVLTHFIWSGCIPICSDRYPTISPTSLFANQSFCVLCLGTSLSLPWYFFIFALVLLYLCLAKAPLHLMIAETSMLSKTIYRTYKHYGDVIAGRAPVFMYSISVRAAAKAFNQCIRFWRTPPLAFFAETAKLRVLQAEFPFLPFAATPRAHARFKTWIAKRLLEKQRQALRDAAQRKGKD